MTSIYKINDILLSISVLMYITSCFMPCILTRMETIYGYMCLLMGGFCCITDITLFPVWCSNILYIYIVIRLCRERNVHIILPIFTSIMAISMIFHNYLEYDVQVPIIKYLVGYYLWSISYFLILLVCVLKRKRILVKILQMLR